MRTTATTRLPERSIEQACARLRSRDGTLRVPHRRDHEIDRLAMISEKVRQTTEGEAPVVHPMHGALGARAEALFDRIFKRDVASEQSAFLGRAV